MNINFFNPTKLMMKRGCLNKLGETAAAFGKKALVVTGGSSVKKNGVFDRAAASLKAAGIEIIECDGVAPNPKISSVRKGVKLCKDNKVELVIAIGGGSVMDCSKAIAAGALYDGDPWDMIYHGQEHVHVPQQALPVITVPTLAATGSEMNNCGVISNEETKEKSFVGSDVLYPKAALVDPELTVTVPQDQTGYGVCDIIVHITESYFNGVDGTPIQDDFALAAIKTCMEYGQRAYRDGSDIEAREQVQWASILALNGFISAGTQGCFPVHMIEHTVSGVYDLTHGAGLSIINPAWMRFVISKGENLRKYAKFASYLFGIDAADEKAAALAGVDKYEEFLTKIGCPVRFSQVDIDDTHFEEFAKTAIKFTPDKNGNLPGRPALTKEDIVAILKSAL